MTKPGLFLMCVFFTAATQSSGQQYKRYAGKADYAKSQALAVGICFPIDVFKQTHHAGLSLDYSYSRDRFGRDSASRSLFRFALNGGLSYNPGKKTGTAGYEFTYKGYLNVYTMGGVDCKPADPLHLGLFAGPVLSVYHRSSDLGVGINLLSNYYLSPRLSLGPGVIYRKYANTNALWSGTFRASYAF